MVEHPDSQTIPWIAVPIEEVRRMGSALCCDIYVQVAENHFAHVFSRATGVDDQRICSYRKRGVQFLYIRREDSAALNAWRKLQPEAVLKDPEIPLQKKVAVILAMTQQQLDFVYRDLEINPKTAKKTSELIHRYMNLLEQEPSSLELLIRMASHGNYLYMHSITTAVIAIVLARATGQFPSKMIEHVGMAGFLHDVGCSQISNELLDLPRALTSSEWETVQGHTVLGLKMIEGLPQIPEEVRYMVYQHHEETDGNGYPNGLESQAIFYPARIISVADSLAAMLTARPYRAALDLEGAIQALRSRPTKYDGPVVDLVESVFARCDLSKQAA